MADIAFQSEVKKLLGEIEIAFGEVRLGEGLSLHQTEAMDDCVSEEREIAAARYLDTEVRWQDIADEKVE